jgi:hypothetical protein
MRGARRKKIVENEIKFHFSLSCLGNPVVAELIYVFNLRDSFYLPPKKRKLGSRGEFGGFGTLVMAGDG